MFAALTEPTSYRVFKIALHLRSTLENGITFCRDLMGLDVGFKQALQTYFWMGGEGALKG